MSDQVDGTVAALDTAASPGDHASQPIVVDNGGCTRELFSKWYYRILRFGSLGVTMALVICSMIGFSSLTTDVLGLGAQGLLFQFVFALIGLYGPLRILSVTCSAQKRVFVSDARFPYYRYLYAFEPQHLGRPLVCRRVCLYEISQILWFSPQTTRARHHAPHVRLFMFLLSRSICHFLFMLPRETK